MTSGLVNASFSLPEGQAVKMIFFAPCDGLSLEKGTLQASTTELSVGENNQGSMKTKQDKRYFEFKVKRKIMSSNTLNEPTEEHRLITPCYFSMPVEEKFLIHRSTLDGHVFINKTGAVRPLCTENIFCLDLELLRKITFRKFASNWLATALASNVFPVPEEEKQIKLSNKFITLTCQS